MATNPAINANTAMGAALVEAAGGNIDEFIDRVAANAPKVAAPAKTTPKKDKPMTTASMPAPADTNAIKRLYTVAVGKKVVVGSMTFLVSERDSRGSNAPARIFTVVKSKGDDLLGRFLFQHELDIEVLAYKPGTDSGLYDDKARLHGILRPLALRAGLAKPPVIKKAKKHITRGRDIPVKPVISALTRMDTPTAPHSQPVNDFGIERLLSAPADKRVTVGAYAFIVEEMDRDDGPAARRYKCVKAPGDLGLGLWVTDGEVHSTTPRIPLTMTQKVAVQKAAIHKLLRDSAIDAGLITGKYAEAPIETISDQSVAKASIKDGVFGRYLLVHPDYDEDCIVVVEEDRSSRRKEAQIVMIRGNHAKLDGVTVGTRILHSLFIKRLRPERMPQAVEELADWLDEVIF